MDDKKMYYHIFVISPIHPQHESKTSFNSLVPSVSNPSFSWTSPPEKRWLCYPPARSSERWPPAREDGSRAARRTDAALPASSASRAPPRPRNCSAEDTEAPRGTAPQSPGIPAGTASLVTAVGGGGGVGAQVMHPVSGMFACMSSPA